MLYVMVGLDGLEPTTSVLSGPRSSRLSYRPTLWVMAKSHLRIIATGMGSGKLNHQTSIPPKHQSPTATGLTQARQGRLVFPWGFLHRLGVRRQYRGPLLQWEVELDGSGGVEREFDFRE